MCVVNYVEHTTFIQHQSYAFNICLGNMYDSTDNYICSVESDMPDQYMDLPWRII